MNPIEYVGDRLARWPTKAGGHEGVRDMTDFSLRLREQYLRRFVEGWRALSFCLPLDSGPARRWQSRLVREIERRRLVRLP